MSKTFESKSKQRAAFLEIKCRVCSLARCGKCKLCKFHCEACQKCALHIDCKDCKCDTPIICTCVFDSCVMCPICKACTIHFYQSISCNAQGVQCYCSTSKPKIKILIKKPPSSSYSFCFIVFFNVVVSCL